MSGFGAMPNRWQKYEKFLKEKFFMPIYRN